MKTYHLFAGMGGGLLADHILGHQPVGACEFDANPVAVLRKRFPGMPIAPDVRTLTGADILRDCGPVDVLAGGSPCQDVSCAGKGAGFTDGARSSLIWHQVRLTAELRPRFLRWENVSGAIRPKHRAGFDALLFELGQLGYGGAWCVLSAAQTGAPHLRKRVWLLAERGRSGFKQIDTKGLPAWPHPNAGVHWPTPSINGNDNRPYPGKKSADGLATAVYAGEMHPTPRVSGRGSFEFIRADGKLRDDPETTAFMDAMWPTATCQDSENAAGPSQFDRHTMPLNAEVLREFVKGLTRDQIKGLTRDQIKAVIGDRRLNPDWVENLMGWPTGWTDLDVSKPRISLGSDGQFLFPAGRFAPQRPHESPRISPVKARSPDAKARNCRLKGLGNGIVPQSDAMAFRLTLDALNEA